MTTFFVEEDALTRMVVPRRSGVPYVHRCTRERLEEVAWWCQEHGGTFVMEEAEAALDVPLYAVSVAFGFMSDYGIIDKVYPRRNEVTSACAYEDTMCLYHSFAEGSPPTFA